MVTVREMKSTKAIRSLSDDVDHETKLIEFDQVDDETSSYNEQPKTTSTTSRALVWVRYKRRNV